MLTVACVLRSGGDYWPEYVTRLRAGVEVHLSRPHRFVCLTDMEMPAGIETLPLQNDWPGWWAKLELFRPGIFEGRVLYMDLDTVVTGSLDEIAGYDGAFAMLSDLYRPEKAASGVMAWEAGQGASIYTDWRGEKLRGGDQEWIARKVPKADRLQALYPGQIVSYKADVRANTGHCFDRGDGTLPKNARLVCFHGRPRPHEVNWIAWRERKESP